MFSTNPQAGWLMGQSALQDLAVLESQDVGLYFDVCLGKEKNSIRGFVSLGCLNNDGGCLPKIFRHKICPVLHWLLFPVSRQHEYRDRICSLTHFNVTALISDNE